MSAAISASKHRAELEADRQLSDDLQAVGTPYFFINGRRLVGAHPLEKFKSIVDEELARAEALIKGGVPGRKSLRSASWPAARARRPARRSDYLSGASQVRQASCTWALW